LYSIYIFLNNNANLLYATLRYSTLLYATLLYATLRYSTLLYATLRYFTLLYSFQNNFAHSNKIGLGLYRRLDENHGIIGCSTYNPTETPELNEWDKGAILSPVVFTNFTGYKNSHTNTHLRSTTIQAKGFRLADSPIGVLFVRNMFHGYQLLEDAYIVGDTDNMGAGDYMKVLSLTLMIYWFL
jgi:hypothetical protein